MIVSCAVASYFQSKCSFNPCFFFSSVVCQVKPRWWGDDKDQLLDIYRDSSTGNEHGWLQKGRNGFTELFFNIEVHLWRGNCLMLFLYRSQGRKERVTKWESRWTRRPRRKTQIHWRTKNCPDCQRRNAPSCLSLSSPHTNMVSSGPPPAAAEFFVRRDMVYKLFLLLFWWKSL